jgi:hypothetical protein
LDFHYHHLFFSSSETELSQIIASDNLFFNICRVIRELCRNVSNVKANISKSVGNSSRHDIDDDNVIAVEKFKNTKFGNYLIQLKKNLLDVRLAKHNMIHLQSAKDNENLTSKSKIYAYYDVKPISKFNDDEITYFDPSVNEDIHRGGGGGSLGDRASSPSSSSQVTFKGISANKSPNSKPTSDKEDSSKKIPSKMLEGPQFAEEVEMAYPFINIITDISSTDNASSYGFSSILKELYNIFNM